MDCYMDHQRDKDKTTRSVRPRVKRWSLYEVFPVVFALLAVDEKHTTGVTLDKSLTEINRVFLEQIDSMWKNGDWVTHPGVEERHVTLDESKQSRIPDLFTNTKKINRMGRKGASAVAYPRYVLRDWFKTRVFLTPCVRGGLFESLVLTIPWGLVWRSEVWTTHKTIEKQKLWDSNILIIFGGTPRTAEIF